MQFKKYTKQRNKSVQGLRSFKDSLPENIKKVINKKGFIYSETLNNWKHIVGRDLFEICYPKSFKNSNKINKSTLIIVVQRGHEVDLEYSKKDIIERMNNFFGYSVVKKLKFLSFDNEKVTKSQEIYLKKNVTNYKFKKKISDVKNEKLKKSLIELVKVFKKK